MSSPTQPTDSELLNNLLDYLDVFAPTLDIVHEALTTGQPLSEIAPGMDDVPPLDALDHAGHSLTSHVLQVRAIREARDGVPDPKLAELRAALEEE